MQVIIPMAGKWQRFKDQGYDKPKYLLDTLWKTIIENIISNFDKKNDIFLFICNETDFNNNVLNKLLEELKINYKIVSIAEHKLWPVYTVLKAENYIHDDLPTIVNYCDFLWVWDYKDFRNKIQDYDGGVICYKWFHPNLLWPDLYAWVKVNSLNELIEIKEKHCFTKNKMDTFQSSWTYYFKNWEVLKEYHKKIIKEGRTCNGEFYTSVIFQLMKEDNLNSLVYEIPKFLQLWTPKDYEEYKYWEDIFRK